MLCLWVMEILKSLTGKVVVIFFILKIKCYLVSAIGQKPEGGTMVLVNLHGSRTVICVYHPAPF